MGGKRYREASWLREKYHEEELTTVEIADICDVDDSTIYRWIERHEIEKRDFNPKERTKAAREAATEKYGEGGPIGAMWKERTDEMIQHARTAAPLGTPAREENGMAGVTGEDAPLGGVTGEDHPAHGHTPWSQGVTGQDHPSWRGGKDIYDAVKKQLPGPSWRTIRKRHRASKCEQCGATDQELHLHHIVPLLAGGTNEPWNLMTLCEGCHTTAEWVTRQYDEFAPVLTD